MRVTPLPAPGASPDPRGSLLASGVFMSGAAERRQDRVIGELILEVAAD
jgi:hypothetical protein